MAKFFVGQRVRILRATQARNNGREDVIVEIFEEFYVDGGPVNCKLKNSRCLEFTHTDQLEPILPEGAQPSEFSFTELMDNLGVVVA